MRDVTTRLAGVLCATVTPFRGRDQEVDFEGLTSNAAWLSEQGIRVLVVNGSIGEASSLSRAERSSVVAATAAAVPDETLLIAGCSDPNPAEVARLGRDAIEAGAHALLVQPPYHFKLRQEECLDFFTWLDGEVACPFILYDNPTTSRTDIEPDTIDRVSRLDHFLGLKEAGSDIVRFAELIHRFGDRFPVVAASEDPLLFMLVAGAPACMTASAAFAPSTLVELVEAVAAGDLARARSVFSRVQAFRRLFAARSRAGEPAYLPYTKAAVDLVGGRAGPPRPPLRPITEPERERLVQVLVQEMGLSIRIRDGE